MTVEKDVLHIDIETYCDLDLAAVGVYKYVEHPSFCIRLLTYGLNDEPLVTLTDTLNQKLFDMIANPAIIKVAHNANFEMTCLKARGFIIEPEQWLCTMVMAMQLGYPSRLELCGKALGIANKMVTGPVLIRLFSKPNRQGQMTPAEGQKWNEFVEYNRQDVVVEHELFTALIDKYNPETELQLIDNIINRRGVKIDLDLVEKATKLADIATAELYTQAMKHTGLDKITDARLKTYIKGKYGVEVDSFNKKSQPELRRNYPELVELLDLREQLTKTSNKKYEAMRNCACKDGRARGLTQFMGAGRTGRWAGRLIQTQNLPRIEMKAKALATAREAVKSGDAETFKLLYDNTRLSVISELIRTALIADEGKALVVADFSAIEARVLAWLADEQWRLNVFKTSGKIYEASAEQMFKLPAGSVTKDSPERQRGKVAELALGYGGGVGALKAMGALDKGLKEEELQPIVNAWRAASPGIVYFWRELDKSIRAAVDRKFYIQSPLLTRNNIACKMVGNTLQISIPSGRVLSYVNARNSNDNRNIIYEGSNQTTKQWEEQELYGAKATENVVQATARDCLAGVLLRAESVNVPPVFHVHDEVVCEVDEDLAEGSLALLLKCMSKEFTWSKGLPLVGDGFTCKYYKK